MENTAKKSTASKATKTVANSTVKATTPAKTAAPKVTAPKAIAKVEAPVVAEKMNNVLETAQNINKQILETATEIVSDVKEMGQEIREVATASIKEVADKVDFSESVEKVKATATSVNKQVKEMTAEITEEVKAKAEDVKVKANELKENTAKLAKEALENFNVTDRLNSLKKAVKNSNKYALETSEELIESLEANTEKWQNVAEKAINTGLKLAERQQNLVFTTLESVKTQMGGTRTRFVNLFKAK